MCPLPFCFLSARSMCGKSDPKQTHTSFIFKVSILVGLRKNQGLETERGSRLQKDCSFTLLTSLVTPTEKQIDITE